MKATDILFQKVVAVLNSDLTTYRIAKEIGYEAGSYIQRLRDGDSSIHDIKLERLSKFEVLYDKLYGGEEE